MFSIGEFARLGSVSVRMLRHYDAIGLLPAAEIDEASGYRRYSALQLPRLHRVVALKELGFSLEEVASVMGAITPVDLGRLLDKRRGELEAELDQRSRQIAEVERRLRLIEKEGSMPAYEFKIESIPRVRFAAIALPAPGFGAEMMTEAVMSALLSLEGLLHAAGIEGQSPIFQVHDGDPDAGTLVTYVGIAVDDDVSSVPEPAELYELPRVEHAAVVTRIVPYLTNYNDIYGEMAAWFEEQGYNHAGAGRDHYVDLSDLAAAVMRTEWPLQRTGEAPPNTTPTPWTP